MQKNCRNCKTGSNHTGESCPVWNECGEYTLWTPIQKVYFEDEDEAEIVWTESSDTWEKTLETWKKEGYIQQSKLQHSTEETNRLRKVILGDMTGKQINHLFQHIDLLEDEIKNLN